MNIKTEIDCSVGVSINNAVSNSAWRSIDKAVHGTVIIPVAKFVLDLDNNSTLSSNIESGIKEYEY
jgi:hypothetical protein